MLTKLFNVAALAKNVVLDTIQAPVDVYSTLKQATTNIFNRMEGVKEGEDPKPYTKMSAAVGAFGLSGVFTTSATTMSWLGLLSAGVAPAVVLPVGIIGGLAGAGLMGKGALALMQYNVDDKEKVESNIYKRTAQSYRELVS